MSGTPLRFKSTAVVSADPLKALVQALAGVFFEMQPGDADSFFGSLSFWFPSKPRTSTKPCSASGLSNWEI
jgi:hypothetical protein